MMRILIVEDLPTDAELAEREIRKELGSCEFRRVDNREDYIGALDEFQPELIVSDYMMPRFDGMTALNIALERNLDVPFIVLTGSMNEETAVECMKAGAWDYVIKEHAKRLGPAVRSALEQRTLHTLRREAEDSLQERVKELQCIYDISRAAQQGEEVESLLKSAVKLIPRGWKYPDRTCARIGLDGNVYATEAFEVSPFHMAEDIVISGTRRGNVEVFYHPLPEEAPAEDPFIEDEKHLIQAITQRLSAACERIEAEARTKQINQILHAITEVNHLIVREKSISRLLQRACELLVKSRGLKGAWILFSGQKGERAFLAKAGPNSEAFIPLSEMVDRGDLPICCRQVQDSGAAFLINDPIVQCARCPASSFQHGADRFILSLAHEKVRYGFLGVYTPGGYRINQEDRSLLREIADDLSLALYGIFTVRELNQKKLLLEEAEALTQTGAWEWDLKEDRFYLSKQWQRIHGVTESSLTPEELLSIAHPDDHEKIKTAGKRTRRGLAPYSITHRIFKKDDGQERIIEVYGRVVCDSNGVPETAFGATTDVTEKMAAEREKLELESQLQQAQKLESVGRLAGGVAHDFNNLLNIILGYSEIVLEELAEDDPRRSDIHEVFRAGERARDLTRQLLAFSRKQTLEIQPLNLNRVIHDFEKLLRRTVTEDIHLEINLSPSLETMLGDIGQIEQVIMNLIVNAQDAMPKGGILKLETTEVCLDESYAKNHQGVVPGNYVVLIISDTGEGMDQETAKRVFEPFYTTKAEGKGTGLGLATVYGIVKQHRGHIWLYSEPGIGTTIKAYFPVAESASRVGAKENFMKDARGGTETILVVEDQETVRRLTVKILESYGYSVMEAENGKRALKLVESALKPIDLLISDVVMPDMNGKELAGRLLADDPDLKVIYMSGYPDDVIVDRGILQEGVHFIQKPFNIRQLAGMVRSVLDSSGD